MTKRLSIITGVLTTCGIIFLALGEPAYGQRMLRSGPSNPRPAVRKTTPAAKEAPQRRDSGAKESQPASKPKTPQSKTTAPMKAAPATTASIMVTVAWQAALDRAGFSPGIIDGQKGAKTRTAIRAFQSHAGLPATGDIDVAAAEALGVDAQPPVRTYTVTEDDAAQVGPIPQGWIAKSKLPRLNYQSLAALVAERGHCSQKLLARLNPDVDVTKLKPGDAVSLPNVEGAAPPPNGTRLEIDFGSKQVSVFDKSDKLVALFHCSIAKNKSKRPNGACKVQTIVPNPKYMFDPKHWPEVKGIVQKLLIPSGPRNPVGLCWIGLSKRGYGIHGTPEPENIGKTGSHGCFRLANWDAVRLSKMVRVGTSVSFTDSAVRVAAR